MKKITKEELKDLSERLHLALVWENLDLNTIKHTISVVVETIESWQVE